MSSSMAHPQDFLEVRVHDLSNDPGLTALCAGYECAEWRSSQLAYHLVQWLPEFALKESERASLEAHNAVALIAKAAQVVYASNRPAGRGEIGELLLHIAIRQVFETIPAVSKYFYKDSSNEIVKGFDAVHVIANGDALELWLGEAKFYTAISSAITSVVQEIHDHTDRNYLRSEFAAITNKIDDTWPHADKLKMLLDPTTSLDTVFDCLCIPVFLTYESPVVQTSTRVTEEFRTAFQEEVERHHGTFRSKDLPDSIRIHLFLLPMGSKADLVKEFDTRLKACQTLKA